MLSVPSVHNFRTLCDAMVHGDVCLVEAQRKDNDKVVAAICIAEWIDGICQLTPVALLIESDPFHILRPPHPDGGFVQEDKDEL